MAETCPYKPEELVGMPMGMHHCPQCSCMVIAGVEHGPCTDEECPFYDAEADQALRDEMDRYFAMQNQSYTPKPPKEGEPF